MLIQRAILNAEGEQNIEAGKWALPGGFVHPAESAYEAAKRELEEETGVAGIHMKQYGVYDKPGRDARGWVISNAHYAIVPEEMLAKRQANDDAANVELFDLEEVFSLPLAFDHAQIIQDGIAEIKKDLLQTTVAQKFLPKMFTYSELQAVLLTITDNPAIRSDQAFARKIRMLPFIEEVEGQTTTRTSKKPTKQYLPYIRMALDILFLHFFDHDLTLLYLLISFIINNLINVNYTYFFYNVNKKK